MSIWDDTRDDWNARAPGSMYTEAASRRSTFMEHYAGGHPLGLAGKPHSACLAQVKAWQGFHMGPQRGWSDLGYNGLICQHGRAIEGRGLAFVGAHCPGYNRSGWGIQFMVGGDEEPTDAAKARMKRLHSQLTAHAGHALQVLGHSDGIATSCPGRAILAWLRAGMPLTGGGGAQAGPPVRVPQPAQEEREWVPTGRLTTRQVQAIVGVATDGIYGPATTAAVARYQTRLGVTADGLWGKATEAAHNRAKAKPKTTKKRARLAVDGLLGPATWAAVQEWVGVPVDGVPGPVTRRGIQRKVGVRVDGDLGPITVKALQRAVGATPDGRWGPATTRALQAHLNKVLS